MKTGTTQKTAKRRGAGMKIARCTWVLGLLAMVGCNSVKLETPVARAFQESRQIQYASRSGADIWQTPAETATLKKGNCVDKAIYLNDLLQKAGYHSRLAFGIVRRPEGDGGHAWVVLGEDVLLDPTDGWVTKTDNWMYIEKRFLVNEFNESFAMARLAQGE